jgi:two-component system sensor histidine kinase DegS
LKGNRLDISYLNDVIDQTVEAVEKGQNEIFDIFEHAKAECERIKRELKEVKRKATEVIKKVDELEKQERSAKYRLMVVSRDFKNYSEEDIREAYKDANNLQIKLTLERQREVQLKEKRADLEIGLRSMMKILNQAEHLSMQVGVALGFLKGNLQDVSKHLSDVSQKQAFAVQIIKAQEEERKRVARDIHDGPAQTLANIVIQAEICERLFEKDPAQVPGELKDLKGIVRGSLKELRKIIFNLRPAALDDIGLEAVTRRYCAEFQEDTQIATQFMVFGDKLRLDPNIEVALFRIIQESLNNVKKHSNAGNASVKLELSSEMVNLVVGDDGKGFVIDPNRGIEDHFGLMSIKERAELFGGTVNIETEPSEGTKIFVSIPLK